MVVTNGSVAAAGAEAAEEATGGENSAEPTEYVAAIEVAIEAIIAVDDPNTVLVSTSETENPTEVEAPTAPTETQQSME
jgi:hypothetical protein